ncbi:MarR family transcriptional regulator [Paractinoplanes globisporus]|uniref:MarR family transcriptional regulator n=1 Tax=Paractinoplanes globisporus TaxID=113565 RepID=A0ABW6WCK2_9ACTN|nr:MarR family transcriptional regulator [Actinoplanes globisporus]
MKRRLAIQIKEAMRDASLQLALLNHQVGARLKLRDVDFDCLNLVSQHGSLGPGALAKLAGLHPATMTGVLDRLEKAGWVARERDPDDRRAVLVRAAKERGREVLDLFDDMNGKMDEICTDYTADELALIAGFLRRTAAAGREATATLTE